MKKDYRVFICALFIFNIFAWSVVYELQCVKFLNVSFFNVGQGDSIFIETPDGHQILIDGGPSQDVLEKLGEKMPFWDRTIDLVILTHSDKDHIFGLLSVLGGYKVENVLWDGAEEDSVLAEEWERAITREGADVILAKTGQKIFFGKDGYMEVLYSPGDSSKDKNQNNDSVVSRLVFENKSFLFMADAGQALEKEIISGGAQLDSDVLKVGHHGSKTSTSKEFIEKVSPGVSVISTGKDNKYGHPHQEALLNLQGSEVLRTDILGDIKIISDGNILAVE